MKVQKLNRIRRPPSESLKYRDFNGIESMPFQPLKCRLKVSFILLTDREQSTENQ
jgi:hypothetical protein